MQGDGRGLGLRMKMGTRAVLRCECQDKVYRVYLGYNGEPLKVTEQGRQMIKLVCSQSLFSENIWYSLADTMYRLYCSQNSSLRQQRTWPCSLPALRAQKALERTPFLGMWPGSASLSCSLTPALLNALHGSYTRLQILLQWQQIFLYAQKNKLIDDCLNYKFFNYKIIFKCWPLLQLAFNRI